LYAAGFMYRERKTIKGLEMESEKRGKMERRMEQYRLHEREKG